MPYKSAAWWRALKEADSSIYAKAIHEVLVIGGISVTPLLIAAFGIFYLQDVIANYSTRPLPDILWVAVLGGQLYFYSMSFIAAVVWHSGQDLKKPFPLRILFWCVSTFLLIVCTFFFTISPTLSTTSVTGLSITSVVIYLLSAIMYVLILIFREIDPPNIGRHTRESEEDLTKRVKRRRGVQE